jgi:hypothetical protein
MHSRPHIHFLIGVTKTHSYIGVKKHDEQFDIVTS